MSEKLNSLEANPTGEPQYESESPAPEQQNAAIENAQRLVNTTMNEIRNNVPGLSQEQYAEIQRSIYRGTEALLQSNQDIYGEPEVSQENDAEKAFRSNTIVSDSTNVSSTNPYEGRFK